MVSKIGFRKFSNLSLCELSMPKITPKITDKITDKPINASVCIDTSHMSTAPQK